MTNITGLPTETLQQIWGLVSTDDITNLYATCKVMRDTGECYREEHFQRRKKYSLIRKASESQVSLDDFFFEEYAPESLPPPPLFTLLSDISIEPILAEYVKEVRIHSCLSSWGLREASWRQFWTKAFGEVLASVMHSCPYLKCHNEAMCMTEEARRLIKGIENGDEDLIVGLLLSLLPRVRTLRFRCMQLIPQNCVHLIEQIARDPTATALSHLTTVEIDFSHGCWTSQTPLAMLSAFAALPSLKTLCAKNVGRITQRRSENILNRSNVTRLALKRISIGFTCLDTFLDMFKDLKSFEYVSFVPRDSNLSSSGPDNILSLLLWYADESLTHLTLYSLCKDTTWMGPLDAFSSLSHIHTDWPLLLDEANPSEQQMVKNLPSTVQQLTLKVGPHFDVETSSILIEKLVLAKKSRFPVLKGLLLLHISCDKSESLRRKPFFKTAQEVGLIINFDSNSDPDRAGFERNDNTWLRKFPTLTEQMSRLLENSQSAYEEGILGPCLQAYIS